MVIYGGHDVAYHMTRCGVYDFHTLFIRWDKLVWTSDYGQSVPRYFIIVLFTNGFDKYINIVAQWRLMAAGI